MDRRMIAPTFTAEALEPLRARGIDPAPLLQAAGIPRPEAPVGAEAFGALWRGVAAAIGDEFFGLGARPMPPGGFALVAHAVRDVTVLDQGLRRALHFLGVLLGAPVGHLGVEGGVASIRLSGATTAFAQRSYWILLHGLVCWLAGRRLPLRAVAFAGAAPPGQADYRQFFGTRVDFGAEIGRLDFDAGFLRLPVARSPAQLQAFLRGAPANLLVRYRADGGLAAAVRRQFGPGHWPDGPTVAARLGLAPSTLRHRLGAEGTSLHLLRDAVRRGLALEALARGQGVADLAADLGYTEPSAFHRAFRKWTGESPGQWARARRLDPGGGSSSLARVGQGGQAG